jgi:hypothetical protein
MTQDDIIEWALEANIGDATIEYYKEELEAFAKLVAAKEREACADICDRFQARDVGMQPAECAGAIRARGEA